MNKKIFIDYGVNLQHSDVELVVVVDVFWSTTNICYLLNKNIFEIILVDNKTKALNLKQQNQQIITMGEDAGLPFAEFDLGKGISDFINEKLDGKTIIYTTTKGIPAAINTKNSIENIVMLSLVNFSAVVEYIQSNNYKQITILATEGKGSEDDILAIYFKHKLLDQKINEEEIITKIFTNKVQEAYLMDNNTKSPKKDLELSAKLNKFQIIPKVTSSKSYPEYLRVVNFKE